MTNIVLFGPPGAGKGTQSDKLIAKYHLTHISTGDLFRKHIGEGTALGKEAKKYMDDGFLVPDTVVIGMVDDKIKSETSSKGFIFDGFPRTVHQAEALDKLLTAGGMHIAGMIALDAPEDELKKRLLHRGKTSGRADDQNEEKIKNRIRVYKEETLPVSAFYKKQHKFNAVSGTGTIDSIFREICSVIKHLN